MEQTSLNKSTFSLFQLGAHSPQVLLTTLIYFNTKYFMLKTADEHKRLAFTHIMKHWKKGQGNEKKGILLRYYPMARNANPRNSGMETLFSLPPKIVFYKLHFFISDKKCYEQHQNDSIPLRCPVKLYEFYLSKW